GGGIAGAALAYFLQRRGLSDILVLEREAQPGYHASGRSAATVVTFHRQPIVRRLIALGGAFLREPPAGFSDEPLVEGFGVIVPAGGAAWPDLQAFAAVMAAEGIRNQLIDIDEATRRHPALAGPRYDGGLLLPDDGAIDVHGLLQAYLRPVTRAGGEVRLRADVHAVLTADGRVTGVECSAGRFGARRVVNAAGAWAGVIGALAGASPIAFTPLRRTIITFDAPDGLPARGLPMIDCEQHRFYVKPESGGFLASPMDETPVAPCDAAPAEEHVAEAIDKVARHLPAIAPRALRRRWAGLRTFAPDLVPVVGEDPRLGGFFWLAGQGGVGIETSPALGRLAADLILDGQTDVMDPAPLLPGRFAAED
ncbi:MAG TPA: FAD-binding oxidoreductase, partial [Polyangia bacterium]